MTSKLDILSQPKLVFLKKHVLAPINRLGSCTKTVVERDKIESDFFQMISLCLKIAPKTTRCRQKNTSHRLFVDGNRPRFSCHKPRKSCPYRRNALKHKKRGPAASPLFCAYPNIVKKTATKKDKSTLADPSATTIDRRPTALFTTRNPPAESAICVFHFLSSN